MKQIGNWVFGSFFRTIGRLLVFVLLGIIISHLIDFGSLIDNFSITNLFFTKVNASGSYIDAFGEWYNTQGTLLQRTGNYSYIQNTSSSNGSYWNLFNLYSDGSAGFLNTTATQAEFTLDIATYYSGMTSYSYTDTDQHTCTLNSTQNQLGTDDYEYRYLSFTCPTTTSETEIYTQQMTVSFMPRIRYGNGNWSKCDIKSCLGTTCSITCHLNSHKSSGIVGLTINVNTNNFNSQSGSYTVRTSIAQPFSMYTTVEDAVNEQTQQQQQQHQEIMDDNTTQAEDDATDFFENFSPPDVGGLSGIITAPLNTIQSLLNSTCTPLVLPLPFVNENLTLPCMTSIYSTHFGAFFTIYQTIILAIVAYRCIRSIYFDIHGFTNPNDDRIEVMDL